MEDQDNVQKEEVVEEVAAEVSAEEKAETEREKNLKAENQRKALEIQRLRDELAAKSHTESAPASSAPNGVDLSKYRDVELKAGLKDPNNAHMYDQIEEELHSRRIRRIQAEDQEKALRLNTELERQKNYPETFDPSHPMAVKMSELMHSYRLDNTPAGRLVAARLASSELQQQKAVAAGRKLEQNRQADVNANFSGESRPAPKVRDTVKLEELKKRAQSGDKEAQAEWFKHRGLIK